MLATFFTVGNQVIVLFLLMLVGAVANRTRLIDEKVVKGMTDLVLYFVTPCVIMESFQRDMNATLVRNLLITLLISVLVHGLGILLAHTLIHEKDKRKEAVLRFGCVFGNCGFMSLPIEEALFGSEGVFYGAVFIAVFNLVNWTYGLAIMSGGKEPVTAKKLIVNPGIIGVLLGVLLFVTRFRLPSTLETTVEFLADLNTPVPMIIIGYYLGNLNLKKLTETKKQYLTIGIRLLLVPGITLLCMSFFPLDPVVIQVCTIASAAPVAATSAMFAAKFDKDAELGAQMVSLSTLFSLITIPVLVTLASVISAG